MPNWTGHPLDAPDASCSAVCLLVYFFGAAACLSILVAAFGDHAYALGVCDAPKRAQVCLGLMLGPLTGWILAAATARLDSAELLLRIVTGLCAAPVAAAAATRSRVLVALSAVFWVAGGYCFTVAVWT